MARPALKAVPPESKKERAPESRKGREHARKVTALPTARPASPASPARPAKAGLFVAVPLALDEEKGIVRVRVGSDEVDAKLAAWLHPSVVKTALTRGEPLVAQDEDGAVVIAGALRTQATPGIERGEDYRIEAERVEVVGAQQVSLVSGASQVVLRAMGMVETLAQDITARASRVHKIVGRMIHLN